MGVLWRVFAGVFVTGGIVVDNWLMMGGQEMETVWAGIISAVAGAVAGGGVAWFLEWRHFKRNRGEQQQIAAMQIASQLRLWLIETDNLFFEQSIAQPNPIDDPERDAFPLPVHIPDFPFENSLERISLLKKEDAQRLFNTIAERKHEEIYAGNIWDKVGGEEAATCFESKIAKIYIDCALIYADLAKQIGWAEAAVPEDKIEKMRARMQQKPA